VAGARVFDRQSRAELRLGPLTLEQFIAFLDDPGRWERLRHALVFASGKELDFSLRLVLAEGEAPSAQLGATRLGRTSWISPDPERQADDLFFTHIAGAVPSPTGHDGDRRRAA
jgi:type VI secretion system protein ImpH